LCHSLSLDGVLGFLVSQSGWFIIQRGHNSGSPATESADLSEDPHAASSISWAYGCPNIGSARFG